MPNSSTLTLQTKIIVDAEGLDKITEKTEEISNNFVAIQQEFMAINDEISQAVTFLQKVDHWANEGLKALDRVVDHSFTSAEKAYDKIMDKAGDSFGDAISDSWDKLWENGVSWDGFTKGLDEMGSIWENAWDGLKSFASDTIGSLFSDITKDILKEFSTLLKDMFKDLVLNPLKDLGSELWDGLKSSLGFGSGSNPLSSLFGGGGGGDLTQNLIGKAASKGLEEVSSLMGLGESATELASSVGADFAAINTEIATDLASSLGADFASINTEIATDLASSLGADFAAINTEIAADLASSMGADFAAINSEIGMSAAGTGLSTALAVAAPIAAFELLAQSGLMGENAVGPIGAVSQLLGLSEAPGYTKETAQESMGAKADFFQRAKDSESGFTIENMQDQLVHFESLSDIAEITGEQVDNLILGFDALTERINAAAEAGDTELVASLERQREELVLLGQSTGISIEGIGEVGSAMFEGAQAVSIMSNNLEYLGSLYDENRQVMDSNAEAAAKLTTYMESLNANLQEVSGGAVNLDSQLQSLITELLSGAISTEVFGQKMESEFTAALQEAVDQGLLATDQMKELADAISSIPTSWETTVTTNYVSNGTQSELHSGGMVMHRGGMIPASGLSWYAGVGRRYHTGAMVSALASDEVPIIAQRGEYVVRRDSVNASTLPLLKELNLTGRPQVQAGPMININAPLVNIEGNLLGSDDAFEDLVRDIEAKLREVASARYRAA